MSEAKPKFFSTQDKFRAWLKTNHRNCDELWVGFYKVGSGIPSMTWPESVDQALCYGWIDGLRKSIDEKSYKIRFTPRRPDSNWSAVNLKKVAELKSKNLMRKAGLAAYEKRKSDKSEVYSFEQQNVQLSGEVKKLFKKNAKAWKYFEEEAPSYRKQVTWWVMSAKREDTRLRRLNIVIECSEFGERIPQFEWKKK